MKLKAGEAIECGGREVLVTSHGPAGGTVLIYSVPPVRENREKGEGLPRRIAQLKVGESRELNLPPGGVYYEATDGTGRVIDVDVAIEDIPARQKIPTVEERLRAFADGVAQIKG